MLKEHTKLLQVLAETEEIIGRKKLQKMVYVAQKLRFPFYEKYEFHFYGPYSEELTLQMEELHNLGLISETKERKGGYEQYRYALTRDGDDFLKQYGLESVLTGEVMMCLNQQSSRFLELVATVLYFEELQETLLVEKIGQVKKKQRYQENEIADALAFIAKLKQGSYQNS
ncbi:YwgA family protein [Aureibacillus halotolerans]|uniref:YwgA family protein n=1 Tax=Aureibacillus halotolerans TaxID=1508390 RepID=A0A4R6U0M5_9BACI|nr:YwgA family protein [Aureibacillus halotolerans]TDQ38772.1 hypothetical protein EV213_109141 [Aureibacillus halotolerans]